MQDNRAVIEEIKERLDIVDFINKYVVLKQTGKNYQGLCPFHNEKTPSFSVSPDINRYKCFGCGRSGDVFNFIQEVEGIDFAEALEKLGKEAGVEIKKFEKNSKYKKLEEINELAANFYAKQLFSSEGKAAMRYLKERGINEDSVRAFSLGFAGRKYSLHHYIQGKKKYNSSDLEKSGLFTFKNGKVNDKFINRIMFPIRSLSGKYIAFTGRQMPGDDFGPKYLNSPETPIFKKGETLYGIYESKNNIRKKKYAVLCEGSTDVITAHAAGIDNIVAPLGTGLTINQVELLKRYSSNLLFFFDTDVAGQKAIARGFKLASKAGLNPYAASPEPYNDLDELIRNDPNKAIKRSKPKVDAFTHLLKYMIKDRDLSNLRIHTQLTAFINELLEEVTAANVKQFYIKKAEKLTGIRIKKGQASFKPAPQYREKEASHRPPPLKLESYFLSLIFAHELFTSLDEIDTRYFRDEESKEILQLLKETKPKTAKEFMKENTLSEDAREYLNQVYFQIDQLPNVSGDLNEEFNDTYSHIKLNYYTRSIEQVRVELAIAEEEDNEQRIEQLIGKINSLTHKISELK